MLAATEVKFGYRWTGESQLREGRRGGTVKCPLRAFVSAAPVDGHPGEGARRVRLLITAAHGFPCAAGGEFHFEATYTTL